jgi:ATP-dependent helicase/DNAse subunit B
MFFMNDSLLAIYPTSRKASDQLTRMARGGCVLGSRITTLPQVVNALWREAADTRRSLTEVGERLVLLEAKAQARSLAFVSADRILALIRQLKSAGLTAADWRAASDTLPAPERARLVGFTPIFEIYENLLTARRLADRHDREIAALNLLHRAEQSGRRPQYLSGVESLLVAEIYDLSLIQFMTVTALIRIIGDAQVTIQAEPHKVDASRFADLTWSRFAGEESIADQVLPEFVRRGGRSGQLGFVVEHIFSGNYSPPPDADATVELVEAPNPRCEAENAARAIRELLERDGGAIALDRIAIVARDLTLYRDYLEAAFRRYRLPLSLDLGQPLRAATASRAILEILRIPLEDYRHDALLAFSGGPFARPAAADYRTFLAEVGYLDRRTRSLAGCVERRRNELADDTSAAAAGRESQVNHLDRLERGAGTWGELLDALATLEPPATWREHLERLVALLERIGFDPFAGSLTGDGALGGAALWRTLDEIATEASRVGLYGEMTLREFATLLEGVLRESPVESGFAQGGAVRALPLRDARGLDFDKLFILGLNDGVFPRYHPEDPLVPDAIAIPLNRELRRRLKRRFGDLTPDAPGAIIRLRGQRNSEEPFLFFLALSMPERSITLSCSSEDEGGRPFARSPFLDEVTRLLGEGGGKIVSTGGRVTASGWQDCFDERDFLNKAASSGALNTGFAGGPLNPERIQSIADRISIERQRQEYLCLPTREELLELTRRSKRGDDDWPAHGAFSRMGADKAARAGAYDGRVTLQANLTRFLSTGANGGGYRWSAAQLSELAACGFKFFARRVLLLRDDVEIDHEPSRPESGILIHRILREYFDAEPDFRRPEAALALAAEMAETARCRERAASRDLAFFDLDWASVSEMFDEVVHYAIARHAEGNHADEIFHEHPFGFVLEGSRADGKDAVAIEGRIDRLELRRNPSGVIDRISVIDYKASPGLDRLAKILRPRNFAASDLQIPVYLLGAVAQLSEELAPDATVQASYIALKHREKETDPLVVPLELFGPVNEAGATSRDTAGVADRVLELVGGAMNGRFDVDPLECSQFCPYRQVCRFEKRSSQ